MLASAPLSRPRCRLGIADSASPGAGPRDALGARGGRACAGGAAAEAWVGWGLPGEVYRRVPTSRARGPPARAHSSGRCRWGAGEGAWGVGTGRPSEAGRGLNWPGPAGRVVGAGPPSLLRPRRRPRAGRGCFWSTSLPSGASGAGGPDRAERPPRRPHWPQARPLGPPPAAPWSLFPGFSFGVGAGGKSVGSLVFQKEAGLTSQARTGSLDSSARVPYAPGNH